MRFLPIPGDSSGMAASFPCATRDHPLPPREAAASERTTVVRSPGGSATPGEGRTLTVQATGDETRADGDAAGAGRCGWPDPMDGALVVVALAAWVWLLAGLRHRPLEWSLLAAAVVPLAALGILVDRRAGGTWPPAGVLGMLVAGLAGLAFATGVAPTTLSAFALGLLAPAGWQGDHLLLRALPLVMLAAHPWRRSWPSAVVSALGVTAFMGIALMMLDAAG